MLAIGWHFYSRTRNLSDYIPGGRGLNRWVAAVSAQAADMSGWLLLGLPGFAYLAGLDALWIAIGLGVGTYLNWRFVARRLRDYTAASSDAITLRDYFESRFRDRSKILRIVSAVAIAGLSLSGGLFELYEIVPGFVPSIVAIVMVSLMGSEPDEEIRQEFARVREGSRRND
jgi:Na+/proline symporter